MFKLFPHQAEAVNQLKTGSILCGRVGSGKSLTAIAYYFLKECGGNYDEEVLSRMTNPKDLFIITTAKKRDSLDWIRDCALFHISEDRSESPDGVKVVVDSWNNIGKYVGIKNAFFVFDEQRVVGTGSWVKSFIKISKNNNWILLSATPGDTWLDYAPVFIANRFYKNITEFKRTHVFYNSFTKYPKVDHYVETGKLIRLKRQITVNMKYTPLTAPHFERIDAKFNIEMFELVSKKRWNPYTNRPIKDVSEYCSTMRKVVNTDPSRLDIIHDLILKHQKLIIFYNFDYELEILRCLYRNSLINVAEHNGHKHDPLPTGQMWVYLVQYLSGAEGWNCVETNTIVFYSQSYSYRSTIQAAGRVDRLNTSYTDLYYYTITSRSAIDIAIEKALKSKKDFNENSFERRI